MNGYGDDDHLIGASFDMIRRAQTQLDVLSRQGTTSDAILQRIELCDVLLTEIFGIRTSLASHVADARKLQGVNGQDLCG